MMRTNLIILTVLMGCSVTLASYRQKPEHFYQPIPSDNAFHLPRATWIDSLGPDFLVNDDTSGGPINEYWPAVAVSPSGSFVIVWQDHRYGQDIYARRFSSTGLALDTSFKVNDDSISISHISPDIAMDSLGNFVVVWSDGHTGQWDIYAQRFDSSGTPLGNNFRVNDDSGAEVQYWSTIAMNRSGLFVVMWEDNRNWSPVGKWDMYLQRFDADGTPLGQNIKVNEDTGYADYESKPAVAINQSGALVAVWEDDRYGWGSGDGDIFAQRYDSSGLPVGPNFKVNDDIVSSGHYSPPEAGMDSIGNFVISWDDDRGGIFAQRYDYNGIPLDSNFRVQDHSAYPFSFHGLALYPSGGFVITFSDERYGNMDIFAQRYNASGEPLGYNFKVSDDTGLAEQSYPAISMDTSGNLVITWSDKRQPVSQIYAQRVDSAGVPLGNNWRVNNFSGTSDQSKPDVAVADFGNFVVTWTDKRNGFYDIYAQCYDSSGFPLGSNFRVNDVSGIDASTSPKVAVDAVGNFVITWADCRGGVCDIWAQAYNLNGIPLGANFMVNDDAAGVPQRYPQVAMNSAGIFVIAWLDFRLGNWNVYAQRFRLPGEPLGSNFQVNSSPGTALENLIPSAAIDQSGDFIIAWTDVINRDYAWIDIKAQRYDTSGIPQGLNFTVSDSIQYRDARYPAVAMDKSGNFLAAWTDPRNGYFTADIYARKYDKNGIPQDTSFRVNDDPPGIAWHRIPEIAMYGSGDFVICWNIYRIFTGGPEDIYAKNYNSSGTPYDTNYLVTKATHLSSLLHEPSVSCNSSKICFSWEDKLRFKGWDIYAKTNTWNLGCLAIPGDVNSTGDITLGDIIHLVNYVFDKDKLPCLGSEPGNCWTPSPFCRGDVNQTGTITLGDIIHLVNYIFDKDRLPCLGSDPENCWTPEAKGACCLSVP